MIFFGILNLIVCKRRLLTCSNYMNRLMFAHVHIQLHNTWRRIMTSRIDEVFNRNSIGKIALLDTERMRRIGKADPRAFGCP